MEMSSLMKSSSKKGGGKRWMTCQIQAEVITTSAFTETYELISDKGPVKHMSFSCI